CDSRKVSQDSKWRAVQGALDAIQERLPELCQRQLWLNAANVHSRNRLLHTSHDGHLTDGDHAALLLGQGFGSQAEQQNRPNKGARSVHWAPPVLLSCTSAASAAFASINAFFALARLMSSSVSSGPSARDFMVWYFSKCSIALSAACFGVAPGTSALSRYNKPRL